MSTRDVDTALLGAPRTLTRDEVRDAVGASEDDARAIWTALGFPVVPPATPAFTTKDAEALRTVLELRDGRVVDFDTILAIARTMGQHLAALAEAQIEGRTGWRRRGVGRSCARRLHDDRAADQADRDAP